MKKFSIILTIAVLCSFAVVRRKEEENSEAIFREAIEHVMEDESLAFAVMDAEDHIGNTDHNLFRDQPVDAAVLLNAAFDEVVLVDDGRQTTWLLPGELRKGDLLSTEHLYKRQN